MQCSSTTVQRLSILLCNNFILIIVTYNEEKKYSLIEPAMYIVTMFLVFVIILTLLLSFSSDNNKQYIKTDRDNTFVKEWLAKNNREVLDKKRKKRRPRYSRSLRSLSIFGDEDQALMKSFKKLRLTIKPKSRSLAQMESKYYFDVQRKMPMIFLEEPSSNIQRTHSELPIIEVKYCSDPMIDAYSSCDSNKTC